MEWNGMERSLSHLLMSFLLLLLSYTCRLTQKFRVVCAEYRHIACIIFLAV